MNKSNGGFSLLEVIVVMAIISVISAVAVPRFTSYLAIANTTRIVADLRNIDGMIVLYQMQSSDNLSAGAEGIEKLKTAKLLNEIPKPPSGQCYLADATDSTEIPSAKYELEIVDGAYRAVLGKGNTAEKYKN
jgi:general secretion pathway protein G